MNVAQAIDEISAKDSCERWIFDYLKKDGESQTMDISIVIPFSRSMMDHALKKLIDKGLVVRVSRGRYAIRGDLNE